MRYWWVLGQEAPHYCHDGRFIRGFQAETAKEALEKAKATKDGELFLMVVDYDYSGKDVQMIVLYPPSSAGNDGIPF